MFIMFIDKPSCFNKRFDCCFFTYSNSSCFCDICLISWGKTWFGQHTDLLLLNVKLKKKTNNMNTIKLHDTIRFIYIKHIYISRKKWNIHHHKFWGPKKKTKIHKPWLMYMENRSLYMGCLYWPQKTIE